VVWGPLVVLAGCGVVPDPVSWLLIRPGWKVYAADGTEVGEVDEVAGDSGADIFNGLSIATSALGKPRYVPAEQVTTINDGEVHLSITAQGAQSLAPSSSLEIEPERSGVLRPETGRLVEPLQHARPANIWERVASLFRRLRG
jgi:hypothetical protein